MWTLLLVLLCLASPQIVSCASKSLGIEVNDPLIDQQSPSYHGSYDLEASSSSCPYYSNLFANGSLIHIDNLSSSPLYYNLNNEDTAFLVLDYLDNDLAILAKLSLSSKRLFRLLGTYFTRKFFMYNPKIFWLLPSSIRFRFASKFLVNFENQFPGLRGPINLTLNDLTALMFLTLHFKNVFYINGSDLELIKHINPNYHRTNDRKKVLPFCAGSVWLDMIISDAVKHDSFYAIEAICKLDPNVTDRVIKLLVSKLGILERNFNEKIPKSVELLIHKIISISQQNLKNLLLFSIENGAISTFTTFLPLWTENLDQIISQSPRDIHILFKIASNRLSCPEILSRPELTPLQLSTSLLICKKEGNYDFAFELLSRFPSTRFSTHFDPDQLDLLKQIVINPSTAHPLHVPQNLQLQLALLLASFHFQQPNALAVFSQLIGAAADDNGRINEEILKDLLMKRSRVYYEIAIKRNNANVRGTCTIS